MDNAMAAGELIRISSSWKGIPYRHFGVDLGDGFVMHLASDRSQGNPNDIQSMVVRRSSLEEFSQGKTIHTEKVSQAFPSEEVLQRAREYEGRRYYHLTERNCEHFARWCVSGRAVSFQVENIQSTVRCACSFTSKVAGHLAQRSAASAVVVAGVAPKLAVGKWLPAAILSDIVDLGVTTSARGMGFENSTSKKAGLAAGCATAGALGMLAGGPLVSSAFIGAHLASAKLAEKWVGKVSSLIGDRFSRRDSSTE